MLYRKSKRPFYFRYFFFGGGGRALYEIMWWKKTSTAGQATDDNMAHSLYMLYNSTDTHSEYAIFIYFTMQKCL